MLFARPPRPEIQPVELVRADRRPGGRSASPVAPGKKVEIRRAGDVGTDLARCRSRAASTWPCGRSAGTRSRPSAAAATSRSRWGPGTSRPCGTDAPGSRKRTGGVGPHGGFRIRDDGQGMAARGATPHLRSLLFRPAGRPRPGLGLCKAWRIVQQPRRPDRGRQRASPRHGGDGRVAGGRGQGAGSWASVTQFRKAASRPADGRLSCWDS